MTKQIRLKDGKVLKVESCLKCPLFDADGEGFMGCYTCGRNTNIDVEYPSQNNRVHNECPLEDYQEPATPKEQGTKCGHLDCHALLTALDEEDSTGALIFRINRGEFDVRISGEALAEKDTKIARLNEKIVKHIQTIKQLTDQRNERQIIIEKRDAEITGLKKTIKSCDMTISDYKSRIQQQDQELKDLGKALQEAKQNRLGTNCLCEICKADKHGGYGLFCKEVSDEIEAKLKELRASDKKEPPKDEPELVICPDAKQCKVEVCGAKNPHKKTELCDDLSCPVNGERSGPCIPVKKEQTVPEMQQPFDIQKAHTAQIETCQGRLDKLEESCDQHYKAQVSHTDYAVESRRRIDALEKEIAAIREKVSNS